MNPVEFANYYFKDHRTNGSEIVPIYCPYCHGGKSHDKYTFALNVDKLTYNCKRGSCGVSGTFTKLCQDFGLIADKPKNFEINQRPQKTYKPPKNKPQPITDTVTAYLKKRGFSEKTWRSRGVGDDGKGNVALPYYENGNLVMMKFRPARKPRDGEKKGWREEGGKPVFWGMDFCEPSRPLVIVEGEMDALALDEAGIKNVVSVPSGAEDLTCVDLCWEWLQKFRKIILWVDNDEPGRKLQRNLINRLGAARCWVAQNPWKDANEALIKDGPESLCKCVQEAVEVPIAGLVRLADIKPFDYENATRIRSGIRGVDKAIGAFMTGEVSIWTGVNSSGKSTVLGQVLLESVEQGYSVCAYSGEMAAAIYRYWIDLQAAGPGNLGKRYDAIREKEVTFVKPEIVDLIRNWYRDKFFLYDCYGTVTASNLLEVFEYAVQRYDCKTFMIDNLMTTSYASNENDFYRKQSEFIGNVCVFAKKYDVHVHLVAHPKKVTGRLTKMDVAGTGDITNRADNVFSVHRLVEKEKKEMTEPCDAVIEVFKNRFSGQQDIEIQLKFDDSCKRFYMASDVTGRLRNYSWCKPGEGSITSDDVDRLFGKS